MKKAKLINEFNKLDSNSNLMEIQNYIAKMMKVNNFNNTPLDCFVI